MLPLLVLVADIIGVMGGYLVSVYKLGFGPIEYINRTLQYLETDDVVSGLVKAAVFGFIVALMGCYQGYHSKGGAQGVGAGHHQGRRLGLDPDPDRQLRGHRAVLQPMTDAIPKIAIRGLTKSFGAKQVLKGVDLDLPGRAFAGGHRRLRHRQVRADQVRARPDEPRQRLDPHRRRSRWWARPRPPWTSCAASSACCSRAARCSTACRSGRTSPSACSPTKRIDRAQAQAKAEETLGMVGLAPEVARLMPAELSGGMQKRVGLARAIAHAPEILFFDEPTTGLDPIMADVINDLIVRCVRQLGATALSITHDMASVRKIADRVAMLYDGRIVWEGPVERIDDSGNPYVDQFIHGRAEGPIRIGAAAIGA